MKNEIAPASVKTTDALGLAIQAAMLRVTEVLPTKTLVDEISEADWANWDASAEKALVADPHGIGGFDPLDEDVMAAA